MSDALTSQQQLDAKIAELVAQNVALTAQLVAAQQQPQKGTKGTKGTPTSWDVNVKKILEEFTKDRVSRLIGLVLQPVKFPMGDASKVLTLRRQIYKALRKSKNSNPHEVSLASLQAEPDFVVELFHEALLKALLESGLQMALYAVQGLELFNVFAFDDTERASQLTEMLGELAKELLPSPTHQEVENMTDGQKEWIARQMIPLTERKKRKHGSSTNAPVNSDNDGAPISLRIVTPKSPSVPVVQSDNMKIDLVEEPDNNDNEYGEPEWVNGDPDSSDEEAMRRVAAAWSQKYSDDRNKANKRERDE